MSAEEGTGTKDETYWKVLRSAIDLDFRKGHLKWTISDLSRSSKITRSLIYYYFGRSREQILYDAVRYVGEELFGFTEMRLALWQEGKLEESIQSSRQTIKEHPALLAFYFSHRFRETPLGEEIRKLERRYFQKMKRFFPKANSMEHELLNALIIGLTLTPGLAPESIGLALSKIATFRSL